MDNRVRTFFRIAPCLLAIIVDYAGFGLVYPLVSVMFTETGVDVFPYIRTESLKDFYLSLAYLLYPFGMFFGASFLGDLSDSLGRKNVLVLAMIGIFISFLLMGFGVLFHLLSIFLLGRFLSGLMAGSQPLSQAAIADVSTPQEKSKNMSLIILTNCVGVILGPLIAGSFSSQLFVEKIGFSIPFFVAALLAVIAFLWLFFGFKETYHPHGKPVIQWDRPIRIFLEAFKDFRVSILALVVFLFQLGLGIFYQMVAIYLIHEFQYSSLKVGLFYGFLGIFFAVGVLWVYPYVLKRYSLKPLVVAGILVNGLMESIIGLTTNEALMWVWLIPLAIFNVVGYTSLLTLFSNSAPPSRQGWVMGIFASAVAIAFIVAGLTANLLPWISSNWLIVLGGVIMIISALLMLIIPTQKRADSY